MPDILDDGTYGRTSEDIETGNLRRRLFQSIVVVSRPLEVEELAVSGGVSEGQNPTLHLGFLAPVLSAYVLQFDHRRRSNNSRIIQFSHFSVKEFFNIFPHCYDNVENLPFPRPYRAAQACLPVSILLQRHKNTQDILQASYAAVHWGRVIEPS